MKNKRALSLVLAIVMILTVLAGCGSEGNTDSPASENRKPTAETSDEATVSTESQIQVDTSEKGYIASKDDFVTKMAELLDLSLYMDLNEGDDTYSYHIKYENRKEYDLDYTIQLGDGTAFTMPITFSELEQMGWSLEESSSPDREIKSGFSSSGWIVNASGKELYVWAWNPTDKTITYKECTVHWIEAQQSKFSSFEKLDTASDFTLCGSLTNASTLEDIIARLGNPTSVFCDVDFDNEGNYSYSTLEVTYEQRSSAYSSLTFILVGDGSCILTVEYKVNPTVDN